MKALVTGAGGFIGRALVKRLLDRGETDLRLFVRKQPEHTVITSDTNEHMGARVEYIVGDLRSAADAARAVDGVGVIYHLAGATKGSPSDMVANSVVGSKNLLEALPRREPPRVILVSSFSVYGTAVIAAGATIDESSPLEPRAAERGGYAYAKVRQELLFREYGDRLGFPLAVVRPGVVYGPGGKALFPQVGLDLAGLFLSLGRNNLIPLSYVDNCAEAIVVVGRHDRSWGQTYNVVDDDLVTSKEYLREYRRNVEAMPYVIVPYAAMKLISTLVEGYHRRSRGQLPAVFTPYKTAAMWKGQRYSNEKIKALGWRQIVPTAEGIRRTMGFLRAAREATP